MSEFRSTTVASKGRISGNTFQHREVKYSALNGIAIFEGDIALGTVAQLEAVSTRPEVFKLVPEGIIRKGDQFRWPSGQIPYRVDPGLPNAGRVRDAIAHWEMKTGIRFIALTAENLNEHADRVLFTSEDGCWSEVGRQGGEQKISLGEDCSTGNAIHEIGHTVGLWHEQSRADRDKFVDVLVQNITPGMEHNFDQQITDGTDVAIYDYGSIMHYPGDAFSKNGQPTIVPKQNGVLIGQRTGLSAHDVETVAYMYP